MCERSVLGYTEAKIRGKKIQNSFWNLCMTREEGGITVGCIHRGAGE